MAALDAPDKLPPTWDTLEIEQHRRYLMRYALLHLRDPAAAEDAVQETLLAAVQGAAAYVGRSSVKTWLTGILKHKIVDHVRRAGRERPLAAGDDDHEEREHDIVDLTFAEDGHWREFPAHWPSPEGSLESKEFWGVFELCLQAMPERTARVFLLRELMEASTEEICKELGISETNCWVMLHRARLSLRECLENRWFAKR